MSLLLRGISVLREGDRFKGEVGVRLLTLGAGSTLDEANKLVGYLKKRRLAFNQRRDISRYLSGPV